MAQSGYFIRVFFTVGFLGQTATFGDEAPYTKSPFEIAEMN
jgi:hypothetical protein